MRTTSIAEEILMMLLWAGNKLTRPTLANLTEPFEAWEQRNIMPRQLRRMEQRQLLARERRGEQWVHQLTELGRLAALGGRDVPARWARRWDGRWRQLLFDLPVSHKSARIRLWRWLRDNGFGYLQQSVWIHPDPVAKVTEALRGFRDDVESLIIMEAICCADYSNEAVVNGAWDFTELNNRYTAHLATVSLSSRAKERLAASPESLGGWLRRERLAWRHALDMDPLLPRELWPKGYAGERAWQTRLQAFQSLAQRFQ